MSMRRGFTLIETLMASGIAVIVLTAIMGLFVSVWMLTKGSSDELQGALRARYARERFFYSAMTVDGKNYGLISATNFVVRGGEVVAQFPDGKAFPRDSADSDTLLNMIDQTSGREQSADDAPLQYMYLAVKVGKTTYYDRMVVPVFGRATSGSADMIEVKEAFGASH